MEVVVEMLKNKQAGIIAPRERSSVRPQNVVNLMDALRSGIAREKNTTAPAKEGRQTRRGPERNRYAEQVYWLEPVR